MLYMSLFPLCVFCIITSLCPIVKLCVYRTRRAFVFPGRCMNSVVMAEFIFLCNDGRGAENNKCDGRAGHVPVWGGCGIWGGRRAGGFSCVRKDGLPGSGVKMLARGGGSDIIEIRTYTAALQPYRKSGELREKGVLSHDESGKIPISY